MPEELRNRPWRIGFTDQTHSLVDAAYIYEPPGMDDSAADRRPLVMKDASHKIVLWAPHAAVQYVERLPAPPPPDAAVVVSPATSVAAGCLPNVIYNWPTA
jgi:hypothetical protein